MALVPLVSAAQVPPIILVPRIGLTILGARWPADPHDPVDLRLSDGTTVRRFDTKITALALLEQTRGRRQAYVSLREPVGRRGMLRREPGRQADCVRKHTAEPEALGLLLRRLYGGPDKVHPPELELCADSV